MNSSGITIDVEKNNICQLTKIFHNLSQIRGNQGRVCFKHPMFQTFRKRSEANFCLQSNPLPPEKIPHHRPITPGCLCWRIALSCHLPVEVSSRQAQLQGIESIRLVAIGRFVGW